MTRAKREEAVALAMTEILAAVPRIKRLTADEVRTLEIAVDALVRRLRRERLQYDEFAIHGVLPPSESA